MDKLLNFILFQIGWFSAVLGGASGRPWFGVIVICFIVLFRLSRVDSIKEELTLILIPYCDLPHTFLYPYQNK